MISFQGDSSDTCSLRSRRGTCRFGFAAKEAAEEGIQGGALVLSVGGGEDGISGCGGGAAILPSGRLIDGFLSDG